MSRIKTYSSYFYVTNITQVNKAEILVLAGEVNAYKRDIFDGKR
ncbi:hypothetical protein D881_04125 [Corynebacterium ulcerans NCTC 12077]|nr:hypothetical protein D881_04125 [Corynebacterium ulcerans NCTC 12077]